MNTTTTHSQETSGAEQDTLRLAVIIGSTRADRFGPVPAAWFAGEARRHHGFDVDLVDLAGMHLPNSLCGSDDSDALGARLDDADAVVVVTPEYNHSYPASLKIAIDYYHDQWRAKPVGFVAYGGMGGGLRAVEHLRGVFAELHAMTVRDTVSFHNFWDRFDDDGNPHDPSSTGKAAKGMLDQLHWWGRALREARTRRPYAS